MDIVIGERKLMSSRFYYTVYLNSTDEIVVAGTAKECAKAMNKSLNCFYSLVSKNRHGIHKMYTVYTEVVDNFELEEETDNR